MPTAQNGGGVSGARYAHNNRSIEYAAFDRLPLVVREALRYADFKYSAIDCDGAVSGGMPAADVVKIIRSNDAKIGGRE